MHTNGAVVIMAWVPMGGRQLDNVLEFGRQFLVLDIYLYSRCIVSFPKKNNNKTQTEYMPA